MTLDPEALQDGRSLGHNEAKVLGPIDGYPEYQ